MSFPPLEVDQIRPDVDDVALLLRTRTVDQATGTESGVFTATTRPTETECGDIIDLACDFVTAELPATLDPALYGAVRNIVALKAAVLVENSFFRGTAVPDSPVGMLDKLADAQLAALATRAQAGPVIF